MAEICFLSGDFKDCRFSELICSVRKPATGEVGVCLCVQSSLIPFALPVSLDHLLTLWNFHGPTQALSQWPLVWRWSSLGSPPLSPNSRWQKTLSASGFFFFFPDTDDRKKCTHLDSFPAPSVFKLLGLLQEKLATITKLLLIQNTQIHLCKQRGNDGLQTCSDDVKLIAGNDVFYWKPTLTFKRVIFLSPLHHLSLDVGESFRKG